MFEKARLKLTGWYLIILSTIVILFSLTIYRLVNLELERMASSQRSRFERLQVFIPPNANLPKVIFFDESEIVELRRRLIMVLASADTIIIVVAGGMGYFLAGKTLQPIEEVMEQQERFVGDSSHELKTPLTALRTSMEVALRDKKMTSIVATQVIKDNLQEVVRLQNLAENLLEMTRSGKSLVLAKLSIQEVIENAQHQVAQIANEKQIVIEQSKVKVSAYGNSLALTRVLVIVLDNAIKYSPTKSKVKITAEKKGRQAVITVTDTGIGIPEEQRAKIFERFYRGDSSRSKTVPGYGLGLAIAKELMQVQGGEIKILSKVSKGTSVRIILNNRKLS